ncbi:MAG: sulfotransferase [Gammaproteobacteria bacterium]
MSRDTPRQTLEQARQRALDLARQGRIEQALDSCIEALSIEPDDVGSLRLSGELHHRLGRSGAARDALSRAVQLDPDSAPVRLSLARALASLGDTAGAAAQVEAALASAPDVAQIQNQAGELLGNMGLTGRAEALFRRAHELDPLLPAAQFNLAMAAVGRDDAARALSLLQTLVGQRPDLAIGWLQLGGVLNSLGRYSDAERALRRLLQLDAGHAVGWTWLGAALQLQGRFDQAEECYRKALRADSRNVDALANLGKLEQAQGRPEQAGECFRRALEIDSGHDQARSGMAAWLDNRGDYEQALAVLETGPEADPAVVAPIKARSLRKLGRLDEARSVLESALAAAHLGAEAQVQLRFSLARVLDQKGEYSKAWDTAVEANELRRRSLPAGAPERDIEALSNAVDASCRAFSAAALAALPRASTGSTRPVFVVGMPRSGKSLVEQILCSHPRVHGAGELTMIGDISVALGGETNNWPDNVTQLDQAQLERQAERYLAHLDSRIALRDAVADRVTDTMPFNFVHLGLIELLFPDAHVIHCHRHPLDLILRCWLKNFAGRSLAFTFALESMAAYFLHYQRLMQHWRKVSKLALFEIRYEALVDRPEQHSRQLVEFLGLEWDPRCLRFFEQGIATSAAETPIRQPLFSREVGGWRHYQQWLQPFAEALDAAGYEHGTR